MMLSSDAETLWPEVRGTILENERFWLGKGFIKNGLLPTEPGRFSTTDGSSSWKKIEEAWIEVLGKGWYYVNRNDELAVEPPTDRKDHDSSCWFYARDFTTAAINSASRERNVAKHWVRFRKLTRTKKMDPNAFLHRKVYNKCDHCDSNVKENISLLLLQSLAFLTMIYNGSKWSISTALLMKAKIIELLDLQFDETTSSDLEIESIEKTSNFFTKLSFLENKIATYVESERKNIKNMFSKVSTTCFCPRNDKSKIFGFTDRCNDLSHSFFPVVEREALAG
eukprot:CAMPEP_0194424202 /NCGR_PEP_ID=MMETSP0176-20130528/23467_1 /TAXON_ID=216777 /ORGANISM="Proboscia alata, Strain PI-D3" /LENGTH=280 /DNA_ID=CAMNT_0039233827 /DNA_START=52 /DNA_END=891 /DNA_ORIENTATION=-